MGCFACCEEDHIHNAAANGPYIPTHAPGNPAGYHATETPQKDKHTINMPPISVHATRVDELKDITDNFGTKYLIGEGSYTVDSSKKPDQEFLSQVSMVSRLRHENVVGLLGYCVDGGLRVLAYEYAPNGSVHDILHDLGELAY